VITRLGLDNVLAFRERDFGTRALTLLAGTNSSGKTSVLHSLALLRQSELVGMLPHALLLNGALVNLGTGRDLLHSEFRDLTGDDSVGLRLRIDVDGTEHVWTAEYVRDADTLRLISAPERPPECGLFSSGFQYLTADRIVPDVTFPKSHEAVTVQRSLGAHGEHAPNFLRVHGSEAVAMPSVEHPAAIGRSLADQLDAWLGDLAPGTHLSVEDIEGTDLVRLVFTRSGTDVKTEPQRATNVGFGLTYALPIVLGCLAATPGSLLLLENPEGHLHPRGQALLGRLCALAAAGGAQVVVETHSDHVLNAVRLAVKRGELDSGSVLLHYLSRNEGALEPILETLEVDGDGMVASWPSGFFDEIDRALDELLS
jgi:predicted ATPase